MLYDADFHVEHVTEDDRMIGTKHGIIITNLSRILQLRAHTEKQALEWTDAVKWVVRSHGKIWLEPHRFGSFAPIRTNCYAQWFADGSDMFTHAANMIELATQDIFITDWWLSPEIYLKRPAVKDQRWRLDKVLKRKAQQGIRIFVMLYKEVEIALNLKSIYSKTILEELHPNIKVIRHPDHDLETGVFFWAHHEKLLIIDQNIAFVGGIDLCFGRWDDYQHRLTDLGAMDVSDEPAPTISSTKPKTLTVHQNVGFVPSPVPSAETELDKTMRLVKVQQKMSKWKQTARENSEIEKSTDQGRAYTQRMKSLDIDEHREKMLCMEREDIDDGTEKFWVGKDYVNFIFKDFVNLDQPFEDFIDRQTTPRMPWHDIGSVVYGEPARDAARHFIQRWNAAKGQKLKKDDNYPLLLPKSYDRVQVPKVFQDIPGTHKVNVQVLRSACDWSAGMNYKEHSIQNAYVDLISNAEHFIYIENQFFVSQIESNDVGNRICQSLYDRIVKAYKNNETFRVYVMLPLLPAFEGQIGTGQSSALQVVLHWAYMSISKGDNSLLVRLKRIMDNPLNYICFCGLRSFDELNGKLVTELVYIHAKLMIVDDKRCIIGSANINDRSQKGDGDSEVCVCVEDVDFDPGVFNSKPYPSGKFCGSLRKHLFQEHLGIFIQPDEEIDVRDPISDHFYFHTWLKIAASNTRIFEKVFNCIPTDSVQSFDDLAEYRAITPLADTDVDTAEAELEEVKGFLVIFPTTFLHYSDLSPSIMSKEGLMPIEVFV